MRTRRFRRLRRRRSRALCAAALMAATVVLTVAPAAADTPSASSSPPPTQASTIPQVGDLLPPSTTSTSPATSSSSTTTSQPAAPTPPVSLPPAAFDTQEPPPPHRDEPISDPLFAARLVADQIQARIDSLTAAVQDADRNSAEATTTAQQADAQVKEAAGARDAAAEHVHDTNAQLANDAVLVYIQGGESMTESSLDSSDSQMSGRTYLGSLMTQHKAQLDRAKAQLDEAKRHADATAGAATEAHHHADDAAAAAKLRHDQIKDLNNQLTQAIAELNSADAASRPLTMEEIAALLQSYNARFANGVVPPASLRANGAVQYGLQQVGKPYVWGGNGPNVYDCSGLTQQSWMHGGGIVLPRVASDQQAWTIPVPTSDAQPGDLVFFGAPAYHVGMYLGNGMMVDAPHQGAYVRVEAIWRGSFSGFGRVPG